MRLRLAVGLLALTAAACTSEARPVHVKAERTTTPDGALAADAGGTTSPFTDLVMSKAACSAPPAHAITRADALADVETVERIVRRGWAGFEKMTTDGADFDAVFAALRRWIASASEPIAVDDFQARLVSELRPARDNHMAFFAYGRNGSHRHRETVGRHERAFTADLVVAIDGTTILSGPAGLPSKARLIACDGVELRTLLRPTVTDKLAPAQRPIVLSNAEPSPLRCHVAGRNEGAQEILLPLRPLRLDGRPSGPAFSLRDDPERPVLTLRTFWNGYQSELDRFVETAPSLRSKKAIVVDVRHNGGGSNEYARRWFSELTAGTISTTQADRLDSEVSRQGVFNDNLCGLVELESSDKHDPNAVKEFGDRVEWARREIDIAERAKTLFRTWKPHLSTVEGKAPQVFTSWLVILADGECASACESFVTMATGLPRAIVVGQNTGGVGVFGEVLPYRLPKSGLGMTAGMKYFHDTDPSRDIVEGRGFQPDLWLDTDDALGLTSLIAACFAKPGCPLQPLVPRLR